MECNVKKNHEGKFYLCHYSTRCCHGADPKRRKGERRKNMSISISFLRGGCSNKGVNEKKVKKVGIKDVCTKEVSNARRKDWGSQGAFNALGD